MECNMGIKYLISKRNKKKKKDSPQVPKLKAFMSCGYY